LVDRLLSADISEQAGRSAASGAVDVGGHSHEELSAAEQAAAPGNRLFSLLAWGAAGFGTVTAPVPVDLRTDDDRRQWGETGLADIRAGRGGVILGRGAAVILADRPHTFHVRLDGPAPRRDRAAADLEGIAVELASERRAHTDAARELWVKRLYHADLTDPKWYHLWIDTTILTPIHTVDVILVALTHYLRDNA
jgi:hypothetical protein